MSNNDPFSWMSSEFWGGVSLRRWRSWCLYKTKTPHPKTWCLWWGEVSQSNSASSGNSDLSASFVLWTLYFPRLQSKCICTQKQVVGFVAFVMATQTPTVFSKPLSFRIGFSSIFPSRHKTSKALAIRLIVSGESSPSMETNLPTISILNGWGIWLMVEFERGRVEYPSDYTINIIAYYIKYVKLLLPDKDSNLS